MPGEKKKNTKMCDTAIQILEMPPCVSMPAASRSSEVSVAGVKLQYAECKPTQAVKIRM